MAWPGPRTRGRSGEETVATPLPYTQSTQHETLQPPEQYTPGRNDEAARAVAAAGVGCGLMFSALNRRLRALIPTARQGL